MSFQNKIAFVTGGATGIGRATSIKLAGKGAKIYIADINKEEANATIKTIQEAGGTAEFLHLDVADKIQVDAVVQSIFDKEGKIDFAVNNAGIGGQAAPLHEIDIDNWNTMMDINLSGVFYCLQAEIKCMLQTGAGRIVNTASLAGVNGFAMAGHYSAAKHGVIGLTKTAALEYGQFNIRCNAICPGIIQTPIIETIPKKAVDFIHKFRVPMKRIGQPEEVANSVSWLLSDESSFINGHSLYIDGGFKTT